MIRTKHSADKKNISHKAWRFDYENRVNPTLMTRLTRKAVPVLEWTDWQIREVEFGFTETLLPLNEKTTNQHGTHQAALMALSADYTGGMALTSVLTDTPIIGIHPTQSNFQVPASLWLVALDMRFVQPSTGHLKGYCRIPTDKVKKIRDRYAQGKRTLISLDIELESNGEIVATGVGKYFLQPSESQASNETTNALVVQKLKASARMIAGIRAGNTENSKSQFQNEIHTVDFSPGRLVRFDPGTQKNFDELAAGDHGLLLASKMAKTLPELVDFVKLRTGHIDALLTNRRHPFSQAVLIGAGLDMRPFRLASNFENTTVFELDLPEMISERQRVTKSFPVPRQMKTVSVPINFLHENLSKLTEHGFNPTVETLFIYEGCSMYFDELSNRRILESVRHLMQNPSSLLWCDFVHRHVIDGLVDSPGVNDFFQEMQKLGEAFVFGCESPSDYLSRLRFERSHTITSQEFATTLNQECSNMLFKYYFFSTAQTSRATWSTY